MAGAGSFIGFQLDAFELKAPFVISRGAYSRSFVLTCEVRRGGFVGLGEAEAHESDAEAAGRALAFLLLARDRAAAMCFDGDRIGAAQRELWG